jgi:hypothetical protein
MRKRVRQRPLRAFGKDHNKLIWQPTRTIGIEPMETHITIPPLEECIVLDLHIQRFLSWAHKGKAHPLACLKWIRMHKEVQALLVDTTMIVFFGSVNPYEGMTSHPPPFPPPPSFVPPSQFVPPPQDDDEEEPRAAISDPQDLYW